MSRKKRRESGRKYNKYYDPDNGFYNEQYWDDWYDYRDCYRDRYVIDGKRIVCKTKSRRLKKPVVYTIRSHVGKKLIKIIHDEFKKVFNNNKKIERLNKRRRLMKTKRER